MELAAFVSEGKTAMQRIGTLPPRQRRHRTEMCIEIHQRPIDQPVDAF